MYQHSYNIGPTDTDSISFCKRDLSPFSEEEQVSLLAEINEISPEMMIWEDDGYYKTIVALAAKNYVLQKFDGSITYKGSGVKATMKEIALKEFIKSIIDEILNDTNRFTEVYNKYVVEIKEMVDISRWSSRKTVTPAVLEPKRTTEQKIFNVIQGTEYGEGDKIRVFFLADESLCLQENYKGEYHMSKMLCKLYDTASLFDRILDTKSFFKNYSIKKNQPLLAEITDPNLRKNTEIKK
jgi:hypothetical protein